MAPAACALDDAELRAQLARYRAVGADAELVERTRRRLVIRVDEPVSDLAVEELVAIEMRCCPFFGLEWEQRLRRLSISVSRQEEEPALDAIVYALGFSNAHPAARGSATIERRDHGFLKESGVRAEEVPCQTATAPSG